MNTHTADSRPGRALTCFVLGALAFVTAAAPAACSLTAGSDAKAPLSSGPARNGPTRPTIGHLAEVQGVKAFSAASSKASR